MRPSMSGGSDFRPVPTRRNIILNILCELNVNHDDVFYCKNVIEHSQAFQLNFANVTVISYHTQAGSHR